MRFLRFKPSNVAQILGPAHGFFVLNEMLATDDSDIDPFNSASPTGLPCFLEIDTVDRRENVDAPRFDADLKNESGNREILFGEATDGRAKSRQGLKNSSRVRAIGAYPNIQVTGCARKAMTRQGIGPHE